MNQISLRVLSEQVMESSKEAAAGDIVTDKKTPHDLIIKEDVAIALKNDKGPDAKLKSYKIVDFTTKGDNYACVVSSVEVSYTQNEKELETCFVVKMNPCRSAEFEPMAEVMFEKEIGFYSTILPMLNAEMARVNERRLRLPRYFHSVSTKQNEIIYLEDLRPLGYRMYDRKKGLDKKHTELILVELARFHAASTLLMSRGEFQGVDMRQKIPLLKEAYEAMISEDSKMNMKGYFPGIFENASKIAGKSKGYEKARAYLLAEKDTAHDMMYDQFNYTEQFKVICHGDSWNNNFLFRYSSTGQVEECRMVDLQLTRVGSPALDLNYMLFCSLNGDVRRAELSNFFVKYYATFASVMAASGVAMKFTLDQLKKEFVNKNKFGLLMGMMLIPYVLLDSANTIHLDDFVPEDVENMMEEYQEFILNQVLKNPLLGPRFLDLFDDMEKAGVIH